MLCWYQKRGFQFFQPEFLHLKPKIDNKSKLQYLFKRLKLGHSYYKYQTICNIYYNIIEFNHKIEKNIMRFV